MRWISAGRLSFLCAVALLLVFAALGVRTVSTSLAARGQLDDARRAQQVSDAYQQARFDVFVAEIAAEKYVASQDPAKRQEFNAAVEAAVSHGRRVIQVGTPADGEEAANFLAAEEPTLRAVQDLFESIESGTPFTGELPPR
jgi:vacuolar-type H+-ATPase subunit H